MGKGAGMGHRPVNSNGNLLLGKTNAMGIIILCMSGQFNKEIKYAYTFMHNLEKLLWNFKSLFSCLHLHIIHQVYKCWGIVNWPMTIVITVVFFLHCRYDVKNHIYCADVLDLGVTVDSCTRFFSPTEWGFANFH